MGRTFFRTLNSSNIFACRKCGCHLTSRKALISKSFTGITGQAFLFDHVINTKQGIIRDKQLRTGMHSICSVYCIGCDTEIGWKYDHAYSVTEKYKVKKTILEKAHLKKLYWQL